MWMASPDLARAFILAKSRWKSRDVVRMSDTLTDISDPVKAWREDQQHWISCTRRRTVSNLRW